MGWNTSALFVRDRSIQDVLGFLPDVFAYEPSGGEVSADEAASGRRGERLYAADDGTWCQLWDPDMRFVPRVDDMIDADGPRILRGTGALAVVLHSVTSTYGFSLYDDAQVVRRAIYESGYPIESVGESLPFESRVDVPSWGQDEDFVWAAIRAVTGYEWDSLERRPFAVYTVEI